MSKHLKIFLLACVTMALTACVTSRTNRKESGAIVGTPVVTQAKRKRALVSTRSYNYWVDLRANKKEPAIRRMHAALATGQTRSAVDMARTYLGKKPGHKDATLILAAGLALQKHHAMAAYYADRVLKSNAEHADALNIKAMAVALRPGNRMKDYRRAVRIFQKSFDADTKQIAAGLNLGHLYMELGDFAKAASVLATTKARCGNCDAALIGYGIAKMRVKDYGNAAKAFETVLEDFPQNTRALYYLALVKRNGYNDKKAAEKYLYKLLAVKGRDPFMSERAQAALRRLKSEATAEERRDLARGSDEEDALLLMTSSEYEEAESSEEK